MNWKDKTEFKDGKLIKRMGDKWKYVWKDDSYGRMKG